MRKKYKEEDLKEKNIPEEQIDRITFHPEFDYASFIGGYKPTTEKIEVSTNPSVYKEEIQYKFIPQSFTNIYVNAWNDSTRDYYLIIEEINKTKYKIN